MGLLLPRKMVIATRGPNSPMAPAAEIAVPMGPLFSPASRRIGVIVPKAVPTRAMVMIAIAAGVVPMMRAAARAMAMEIPQAASARFPVRPRMLAMSISLPAMKKSNARPRLDIRSRAFPPWTHPSIDGPIRMPRRISKTIRGMETQRRSSAPKIGARSAAKGMRRISNAMSLLVVTFAVGQSYFGQGWLRWRSLEEWDDGE